MKKKALIIANNDGLPGVGQDVINIQDFLHSLEGGAWNTNEITTLMNPTSRKLEIDIGLDRMQNYDYYLLIFTGHGCSNKRETFLSINKNESIAESMLKNISGKQINIYDCCRPIVKTIDLMEKRLKFEAFDSLQPNRTMVRAAFENRIAKAAPQQIYFYSCKINEYSWDTSEGALYLTNLLKAAANFSYQDADQPYKLAIEAHVAAAEKVKSYSKDLEYPQNPDYAMLRLPSSQQLILSINPKDFVRY